MKLHEFSKLLRYRTYAFIAKLKLGVPMPMALTCRANSYVLSELHGNSMPCDPRLRGLRASLNPESYSEEQKLIALEMVADWWAMSILRVGLRHAWDDMTKRFLQVNQCVQLDRSTVIFIESILYSRQHGIPVRDSCAMAEHWGLHE